MLRDFWEKYPDAEQQLKAWHQEVDKAIWVNLNFVKETELEVLALLIEDYEERHYPISPPDPIEAIKFRMEQGGMKQADLARILGQKSRTSEILNKKRKLTLKMVRVIGNKLNISAEFLVQEY